VNLVLLPLNCMFRAPDVFGVGVSVAPVADQRLYDTIYQERDIGLPESNQEGHGRGSSINFRGGLHGKLIIHGSGDDGTTGEPNAS
jgi:dipeptidyl-peptidase-4